MRPGRGALLALALSRRAADPGARACAANASASAAAETPLNGLKEQRDELERIRLERADLQRRMRDLQSTVHDLSEERTNIACTGSRPPGTLLGRSDRGLHRARSVR